MTGGGWINSPAGAHAAGLLLAGKANVGFVSRYQPGATVPTGSVEFQFKPANLSFRSSSYDWLVVVSARAQFKGTGRGGSFDRSGGRQHHPSQELVPNRQLRHAQRKTDGRAAGLSPPPGPPDRLGLFAWLAFFCFCVRLRRGRYSGSNGSRKASSPMLLIAAGGPCSRQLSGNPTPAQFLGGCQPAGKRRPI